MSTLLVDIFEVFIERLKLYIQGVGWQVFRRSLKKCAFLGKLSPGDLIIFEDRYFNIRESASRYPTLSPIFILRESIKLDPRAFLEVIRTANSTSFAGQTLYLTATGDGKGLVKLNVHIIQFPLCDYGMGIDAINDITPSLNLCAQLFHPIG